MYIPTDVKELLGQLAAAGHEAYAVGGCVRDSILGRVPGDWDICTSALPEETERCFSQLRVIETGLKHGTVTVMYHKTPYEITTYRRDGVYTDHRKPEQVTFVSELREDLARRDFTINAMAVDEVGEIVDPFGGRDDLAARCIRCVGAPEERFREDALRILRGLRFASQLEFEIHPDTAAAMDRCKELLQFVSGERIYVEITKLLVGNGAAKALEQYGHILAAVLPEILPAMGFQQRHPCHNRDVWGHTADAVGYSKPDPVVRWTLLLHDLGKPDCFTVDDQGIGHFYGHPKRSAELALEILTRLKTDSYTRDTVCELVRRHDEGGNADKKTVRRWIGRLGEEKLMLLLEVKRADCLAHRMTPKAIRRCEELKAFTELTHQVLAEEKCFRVSDLAVNGKDVLAAGAASGPLVGRVLEALLAEVMDESCGNDRSALLARLPALLWEMEET